MVPPDLIMMVVKSRGEIKNRTNFCRSSDHEILALEHVNCHRHNFFKHLLYRCSEGARRVHTEISNY